ncbi:site-specific DNA-methyltransferase, partial [candidate division KSB1 bacterium]|nr:site-specific DNA-methyltransferase [candidate division KSB1 bacterium]
MARKKSSSTKKTQEPQAAPVKSYRYPSKRKNNPPAGLAAQGKIRETPKLKFAYDPHLPPVLRFDDTGASDKLPELLQAARTRPLTAEEAQQLAEALRRYEPWLEWAGKREKKEFEVDPVALHIHERVSAQAILKVAAREDPQRELFADPQQEYREAVQFYQHDVDWANRMILGDSLQVMASLAHRENLAGKVQMIYMDPPYGIKFSSNFQPEIGKRDVKDKEADLTREPEMVKAYRDTWTLGVHSYLAYLRDRLYLCQELLADTGSIFVQISDENLHRVRSVMDEVFGVQHQIATICYKKPGQRSSETLNILTDFILWYAKDKDKLKCKKLFVEKVLSGAGGDHYVSVDLLDGIVRPLSNTERSDPLILPKDSKVFETTSLYSAGWTETGSQPFQFNSKVYNCGPQQHWSASQEGMMRLAAAERIVEAGKSIRYKRYFDDFRVMEIDNRWDDVGIFGQNLYVVQTSPAAIERCILLTTDPGDLVLDPTCGSGTTAYVAEQWGRRWITMDTSRVALALARQRLLTAKFDYYKLRLVNAEDLKRNPHGPWLNNNGDTGPHTFDCKTVPHITLKSIAQNVALDAIFAKHQPILDEKLAALNKALKTASSELRQRLLQKLYEKEKREGKKSITDADRRRWLLPSPTGRGAGGEGKGEWKEWEVPFDTDDDWPENLQTALTEYRKAWRKKMDEVNAGISANAEQEELVDQPQIIRNVVRVSGPFTMEAVMPAEESLAEESPIEGAAEEMETFDGTGGQPSAPTINEPTNAEAYLDKMLRLLRADG